jgi:GNAT superfamily N-acetyltransferase
MTALLHRAFAPLGMEGLNCECVDQSIASTRRRATAGDCYVAMCGTRMIGTVTLCAPERESPCEWYRRDDVSSLRQFAVDPAWQRRGVGTLMLGFANHWAAMRGYAEMALDTPRPAVHLISFYRAHGFRIVDSMHFDLRHYESAILSCPALAATRPSCAKWLEQFDANTSTASGAR